MALELFEWLNITIIEQLKRLDGIVKNIDTVVWIIKARNKGFG